MANAEDQQDVIAAQNAQAEAKADVAEFDENALNSVLYQSGKKFNNEIKNSSSYLRKIESPSENYIELISSVNRNN